MNPVDARHLIRFITPFESRLKPKELRFINNMKNVAGEGKYLTQAQGKWLEDLYRKTHRNVG